MLSKEAKQKLKNPTLESAISSSNLAVKKTKKKHEQKSDTALMARLVMLDLDNHKKKIALQQQGRGINRLHKIIDRLRAEREKETAIFKMNMAMLQRRMLQHDPPFKITFVTQDNSAPATVSVGTQKEG